MTNNAQLLPLPEDRLSEIIRHVRGQGLSNQSAKDVLSRAMAEYALACIDAAKPTCKQPLQVDALGSLPEPNVCYLHTPVHECDPMKLPVPQYAYSPELFRAEIAKRDAEIEKLKYQLGGGELAAQELERQVDYLRAKLAGVDGLVEALREVMHLAKAYVRHFGGMSDNSDHESIERATLALATYEAAQGEKK